MMDTAYYTAFILVLLRITCFFLALQVFFPKGMPNTAKIGFTVLLSYILLPGLNYSSVTSYTNTMVFIGYCFSEIITGLLMGFITNLCFISARVAGQFMDIQIGFGMISMYDPNTNSNTTFLERILELFSVVIFFAIDGHHMLIKSLSESFNVIGLGKFILNQDTAMLVINAFIQFFAIGIKIALPIILVLVITDIVMGLVARTVPQLNLMILSMPVKIMLGLTCFSLAFPLTLKLLIYGFGLIPDVFKGLYKVLPLIIIFASEEKTEEATPKKKSEARKKGQVARSKDVSLSLTLLTSTLVVATLGVFLFNNMKSMLITYFGNYLNINSDLSFNQVNNLLLFSVLRIGFIFLCFAVPIMVVGVVANFIQTGFILTGEPLKPDLKKLNPINGFKRIFSMRTAVDQVKNLAVVITVGVVGYSFVKSNFTNVMMMSTLEFTSLPVVFKGLIQNILARVTLVVLAISLADYIYQRYQYNKDLRMTKQEIKEEYKQDEGNPEIKSKRRQKMRELSTRRMMQNVPNATVVVTNPTHIAVALKYEQGENSSPVVVAKGADQVAIKIKEIAKDSEIPIIENKPLARLIYKEVEIDQEIPVDMYEAVAEILALVYKMKKRK
ncbi:MAG: fused FliR family export protein/FlhB family type III secretion system protein [Bacillota bacterium]|nr:fused FliR family export protein/FlhB family type III secretion system protein [Bacillota bacterium]